MKQEPSTRLQLPDFPDKSIALIGMMGAGKTTIGRRLALMLGWPFRDADEEIEKACAMAVSDYFTQYGEEAFRKGERRVIRRLLTEEPTHVLATGGGAFCDARTRQMMHDHAVTVWLRADLETLVKRTSHRDTRPLLRGKDSESVLRKLLEKRSPFYAEADIIVDSVPGPHKKTLALVIEALKNWQGAQQKRISAK